MSDTKTDERLARIEERLSVLEAGQKDIRETMHDIKGTLAQMLPVLVKLSADVGEMKGQTGTPRVPAISDGWRAGLMRWKPGCRSRLPTSRRNSARRNPASGKSFRTRTL